MTRPGDGGESEMATLGRALAGQYRVIRELGRGGMGCVYLASDLRHGRDVAIKVLGDEHMTRGAVERFEREVLVVARLSHPHIVPLLDSGQARGLRWFVMPFIEGESLRERITREKRLDIDAAVTIAHEVSKALSAAHAHNVLHRDVKPENILLSGGSAVVTDFGIAKMLAGDDDQSVTVTRTGYAVGSAAYMSPEQATGVDPVDERSDVYGLGCVLFEMLTGQAPFTGPSMQAVIAKRFSEPAPRASSLRAGIAPAIDAVLARALAREPRERFGTMHEFEAALSSLAHTSGAGPSVVQPFVIQAAARRHLRLVIGTVVALAVLVMGMRWLGNRPAGAAAGAAVDGAATTGTRTINAIAVRPLTDISSARNADYLSAGMTDELLTALSGIKGLRVAARTSSYATKNIAQDLKDFGTRLQVDAVLDGTVQKEGDRVKVSVELVTVKDGFSVWKRSYDGDVADLFSMQENVARAIVSAVGVQLGDSTPPIVKRSTTDIDAYQLYMKGRLALDKRTAPALIEARGWFEKAVARDSGYARAWAGLADVAFLQAMNVFDSPGEAFPRAKQAVKRALALDSNSVEAQTSSANVLFYHDREYQASQAAYRRAIALDPRYPQAHYWYALMLTQAGRPGEGLAEAKLAASLDPFSPPIATSIGMVHVLSGQFAEAVPALREAITVQPNYFFSHAWLSLALAETGVTDEAAREARRGVALAPDAMLAEGYLAYVLARTGQRDQALLQMQRVDSIAQVRSVASVFVARAWDVLGNADSTFSWLARATKEGDGQLAQVALAPHFKHVANDPRFTRLLQQLRIPKAQP